MRPQTNTNGKEGEMAAYKTFFYAKNLADIFYQVKSIPDIEIVAGCTSFAGKELPEKSIPIRDIPELKVINKHERYIEFGSCVTLSEIEDLGEAKMPATLHEAITTIANRNVKNIATIGGNIASKGFYNTLFAPLLAHDARLEMQDEEETIFKNLTRFDSIPKKFLLTKVRIPLEEWEISVFKRVGPEHSLNELSASFVFLANSQRNQISDLRIAMAGSFKFRDIDLENKLIGAHLPLSETAISNFLLDAEESFNEHTKDEKPKPILKRQFWNLVKYSLEQLT